jgi:hypothetical protein
MPSNVYKFSNDASGEELLQLGVILYAVCLSSDITELNRFVVATAKVIGPDDFNSLTRRVCKMLEGNYTTDGKIPCSDWLMNSLYELYRSIGE